MIGKVDPEKRKKVANAVNQKFAKAKARGNKRYQVDLDKASKLEQSVKENAGKVSGFKGAPTQETDQQYRSAAATGQSTNMSSNAGNSSANLKIRKMSGEYNGSPQISGADEGNRKKGVRKSAASKQLKKYYIKKMR